MNKYRRVVKPKEVSASDEQEIRVTSAGSIAAYISRAAKLMTELEKDFVVITATGNALVKAVTAAEVIKRRFKGLHQVTKIMNQDITEEYEPIEEGLDPVTQVRSVACVEIKLSKSPLDTDSPGYQEPIDEALVKDVDPEELMKTHKRSDGNGKGKGKGKDGKGKGKDKGKSKGKGKGKDGKEGKSRSSSPSRGGKGKGKSDEKGRSIGKNDRGGKGFSGRDGKNNWNNWSSDWSHGGGGSWSSNAWSGYGSYGRASNHWNDYSKSSGKGKNESKYGKYDDYDRYSYGKGKGKNRYY